MRYFNTLLIALLASVTLVACDDQGPMEETGEAIDESVEDVREGTEDAIDDAGDAVDDRY